MEAPAQKKTCRHYKIGETTSTGAVVRTPMAASDKCFVFVDTEGELGCEFEETLCINGDQTIREAMDLYVQMQAVNLPRPLTTRCLQLIAAGLSHGFEERVVGDDRKFFADAHEYLATKRLEQFQRIYILSAFGAVALVGIVAVAPSFFPTGPEPVGAVMRAAGFGGVGALLSVLLRFRKLVVARYASRESMLIEGVVRILLGAAFGLLFIMLQRSGLLLTVLGSNAYSLACAATVSGFSERLVPGLLGSLEGKLGSDVSPNLSPS